jgi:hypothetical protein
MLSDKRVKQRRLDLAALVRTIGVSKNIVNASEQDSSALISANVKTAKIMESQECKWRAIQYNVTIGLAGSHLSSLIEFYYIELF